jgi:inosine-uridine nucleoside N-ribohydrolase
VTLCALSPLTNVALALAKDPEAAARLEGIAFMGGAAGLGNSDARSSAARPLCVVAWLIAPEIFTGARHHVAVELEGMFCQGRTVVDAENLTGNPSNMTVMNDLERGGFLTLLEERLGRRSDYVDTYVRTA